MTPPAEFPATDAARHVLERAARSAGTPLSVHLAGAPPEDEHLAGWGGCAACKWVGAIPAGERACRAHRRAAQAIARRQGAPVTFTCHLGLTCVSIACPGAPELISTFGPYLVSGAASGLEAEMAGKLAKITGEGAAGAGLPFSLADIRTAPRGTVASVAEWAMELLGEALARWRAETVPDKPAEKTAPERKPAPSKKEKKPEERPSPVAHMTVLLSARRFGPLRRALEQALAEGGGGAARLAALVASLLDAAQQADGVLANAWPAYARFSAGLASAEGDGALVDAAIAVLRLVEWPARPEVRENDGEGEAAPPKAQARLDYTELNRLLLGRLDQKITLEMIAGEMGVGPTAVTHRLQRRFGLSFSDYLGRLRVEKAKEHLRRTRLTLREVGARVGVGDPSNLGRLFRKHTGMSPGAYRMKHGKKKK